MKVERKIYVDFMKCCALMGVFCVHFIGVWGGWLNIPTKSHWRILALIFYFISFCCVPIFFMATGILLNNRLFSWKNHYIKVIPIIVMYILASATCAVYKFFFRGESIEYLIKGVFSFRTASYSWYIKYYLILFLVIPLINMILYKINRKHILGLTFILVILSSIGSYGRYNSFIEANQYLTFLFKVLKNIFPLLYYMIGYLLEEYRERIKKWKNNELLIITTLFLVGNALYYHMSNYGEGVDLIPNGYGTWNIIVISILVAILTIRFEKELTLKSRKILIIVSNSTLIAYLVSEIFDNIASAVFRIRLPFNLLFIFPWVLFVAVLSISISIIETYISKKISNKIASVFK